MRPVDGTDVSDTESEAASSESDGEINVGTAASDSDDEPSIKELLAQMVKEQEKMAGIQCKIPILNNMALGLSK